MITIETKVTIQASERDIKPLQNFVGWLEDMDDEVFEALDNILPIDHALLTIMEDLRGLLDNIEVY